MSGAGQWRGQKKKDRLQEVVRDALAKEVADPTIDDSLRLNAHALERVHCGYRRNPPAEKRVLATKVVAQVL